MAAKAARIVSPAKSQNRARGSPEPNGVFRWTAGGDALDAPPVVIVSVAVADDEFVRVTEDGDIEHPMLAPGVPQLRATVPVKPATGAIVTKDVPDCPGAAIVMVLGFGETLKSEMLIVAGEVVELA
jgi:hypothetical protein